MRLRDTAFAPLLAALVAAATTWVATLSWRGFTIDPGGYLQPLAVLGIVVAGTGLLARQARLPWPAVLSAQLATGGLTLLLMLTGSALPDSATRAELHEVFTAGADAAAQLRPPVPVVDGVRPLLLAGGLACLLLVDLLACSLRRSALAGLPLLGIFAVPLSVVDDGVPWWCFAATVAGYLTLLVLQQSQEVGRWGRRLDQEGLGHSRVVYGAGAIGVSATALALVVPASAPTLELDALHLGTGGGGGGSLTVTNPMVGIRHELNRGEDIPLVHVTTDDPSPGYLRIAALARFTDEEWTAGDRKVPSGNRAHGDLPAPQGVSPSVRRSKHDYAVHVAEGFDSRWLPTQQPISAIEADGDWRYDTATMDFLGGEDQTAAGMDYSFTALDLDIKSADLQVATTGVGSIAATFREVPGDFPQSLRDLAREVTDSAQSPFAKAVALQRWFRSDGGFRYDDTITLGTGPDDLAEFLGTGPDSRVGFCQQFATAMAALARTLGIPSRVAVGFLAPDRVGEDSYVYSAHDMHAWPELFFSGAGWVRFEPTPAVRARDVPDYTVRVSTDLPDLETASAAPQTGSSGAPSAAPKPREEQQQSGATEASSEAAWWLGALALALTVTAAALAVPSRIRRRRRAARLADRSPEAAWAEVRDTVLDTGRDWPEGVSPRAAGTVLTSYVGSRTLANDALQRLVGLLELARYSPRAADRIAEADILAILEGLTVGLSPRTLRRAQWWPRSVVSRAARTSSPEPELVDAIG